MSERTILLIEPDIVLANTYIDVLKKKGFSVSHVVSAQDAVIAADAKKPDLVICELQLVSHSGIEFLYEFRSYPDWRHIPVIVLSLVPMTEFKDSMFGLVNRLGVVRYLYKPMTGLIELIREVDFVIG